MFRLNLVILMPISQHCLHNDQIGITLRPYWSVYYVVGKPIMYTLRIFSIYVSFLHFEHKRINKRKKK